MKDIGTRGLMTRIIHAGQHVDPQTGAVATPIYQTSTFAFKDADHGAACFRGEPGYKYTRLGNPTIEALENNIAELEKGAGALGAASGMAAVFAAAAGALLVETGTGRRRFSSGEVRLRVNALAAPGGVRVEHRT